MLRARTVMVIVLSALLVTGCSQIKRLTGQRDDTILPGERESVLSPSQTKINDPDVKQSSGSAATAPDPNVSNDLAAPCDPEIDSTCTPPAKTGTGSNDGVFSDGQ